MHLSPLVAWDAVRSKAVVLLLLKYCLMHFQLFVYALLCVHSSFATILKRKRKLGLFYHFCLTGALLL